MFFKTNGENSPQDIGKLGKNVQIYVFFKNCMTADEIHIVLKLVQKLKGYF